MVRPSLQLFAVTLALFKVGAVPVMVDPGIGLGRLKRCLDEAEPEAFIGIPQAHAARLALGWARATVRISVTVGRRWFWGGATLEQIRGGPWSGPELTPTGTDDPAAIIFTTGSTGPPKGVLYRHGNFDAQVEQIQGLYGIEPGEVDLPGFPLFGLFNCAMGVTTVIPDMDPSRPATVDPEKIIEAVRDWHVTQAFGSPAIWNRVGRYCEQNGRRLDSIRRVLSAGAPVPADVLRRMKACINPEGDIHTPYGATEALPVASISGSEVLSETAEKTSSGGGICVGRKFPGISWKVIRIVDGPIGSIDQVEELPTGKIGELLVTGAVVTREYCTRVESNLLAKISDGPKVWHRMGDVGYLDEQERFWVCGRMAHRLLTARGPMYTLTCEAITNQHPAVFRSALVGVGPPGRQRPVMVVQPFEDRMPGNDRQREKLLGEIRRLAEGNPITESIDKFLLHESFPVDIRHNAKIFREKLAIWAAKRV
jgi:acyl-CoA synthetase (AMP-forming)/AMP-acid ligase II